MIQVSRKGAFANRALWLLLPALLWAVPALAQEAATETAGEAELGMAVKAAQEAAEAARDAARAALEATRLAREAAAPTAPVVVPVVPAPVAAKPSPWSSTLSFAVISTTGNADAVTAKIAGNVKGEWRGWSTELRLTGAYGQAGGEAETEPTITAENFELRLRGDRALSERLKVYVLTGLGADRVASIGLQYYGEPGLSLVWLERKEGDLLRLRLATDLGARVLREEREQFYPTPAQLPDNTIYAMRVAADFRYALTKDTVFAELLEILPDVIEPENLRVNSTSMVSVQVVEGLAIQLSFTVRHIGQPAPGKVPTDTELAAGVNLSF